jgi:hypothetical protein
MMEGIRIGGEIKGAFNEWEDGGEDESESEKSSE